MVSDPTPTPEDREKSRQWATERFGPRDTQRIIQPHEWDEFVELRAVGRAEGRADFSYEAVRLVKHLEGCLLGVRDVLGRGTSRPLETALRRAKDFIRENTTR